MAGTWVWETYKDLTGITVVPIPDQTYTGSELKPTVLVIQENKVLVEGTDYSLTYAYNINPGQATVTVTGITPNTGSVQAHFNIICDLSAATVTVSDQDYTGEALTPAVTVMLRVGTMGIRTLSPETDYDLIYNDNVNPGTATVIITGKGYYSGMAYCNFAITDDTPVVTPKTDLSAATVEAADQDYTGEALTPAVTVTLDGTELSIETDYNLVYVNNTDPGAATVIVTGKGDYVGMAYGTFRIRSDTPTDPSTGEPDPEEPTSGTDDIQDSIQKLSQGSVIELLRKFLKKIVQLIRSIC